MGRKDGRNIHLNILIIANTTLLLTARLLLNTLINKLTIEKKNNVLFETIKSKLTHSVSNNKSTLETYTI